MVLKSSNSQQNSLFHRTVWPCLKYIDPNLAISTHAVFPQSHHNYPLVKTAVFPTFFTFFQIGTYQKVRTANIKFKPLKSSFQGLNQNILSRENEKFSVIGFVYVWHCHRYGQTYRTIRNGAQHDFLPFLYFLTDLLDFF